MHIIFTNDNVDAIIAGVKGMTRRVARVPRTAGFAGADLRRAWADNTSPFGACLKVPCAEDTERRIFCPYGEPGTVLQVIEAHYRWGRWVKAGTTAAGRRAWRFKPVARLAWPEVVFRLPKGEQAARRSEFGWHHRPPFYLPREHSRLSVRLIERRAEHLQEISEEDARAEGAEQVGGSILWQGARTATGGHVLHDSARGWFQALWDSINGKRPGCSWDDDPWVWALAISPV